MSLSPTLTHLTISANAWTEGKALANVRRELGTAGMDGFRAEREPGHNASWGQGSICHDLGLATMMPVSAITSASRGPGQRIWPLPALTAKTARAGDPGPGRA